MGISDGSSDVCSSDLKAWTPGTDGPVEGEAIAIEFKSKADIEKHKGKLRGKIVFLDPEREYKPGTKPDFQRHDEATLEGLQEFSVPVDRDDERAERIKKYTERRELAEEVRKFLVRSEEHTSELQSLMRISYAVFC